MKFRTKAIHIGNQRCRLTGAVVPIHLASTYVQEFPGEWGEYEDHSRSGNPTRDNMETTLAALENGIDALAFSSGMAATHCVTMLLNAGDHIVAGTDIYGEHIASCTRLVTQESQSPWRMQETQKTYKPPFNRTLSQFG